MTMIANMLVLYEYCKTKPLKPPKLTLVIPNRMKSPLPFANSVFRFFSSLFLRRDK